MNETNTQENTKPNNKGSKIPIGPIAGGVVGALAILCMSGVAVFYIKRRHPRSPEND
ncbi:hypothetical protein BU23DRAFT_552694, partial [Bimuria novae-zelandiae CBS 107.79]